MPDRTVWRIMAQIPKEGIERALPYTFYDDVAAGEVCSELNRLLEPEYHHYTFTTTVASTNSRKGAYHGRR
jgi:hypothetical protein